MQSEPLFSIVTAALNRADHLEGCLESVAAQRGVAVEHIVIDGGSTDGSREMLRRWSDRLAYWCSEPDSGIADAMNKGLRLARGHWVLFLHADDELLTARSLADAAARLSGSVARIVGFPIRYGARGAQRRVAPRGANAWLQFKSGFLHQGTFIRRSVFAEIGEHDTQWRIAMDYEFFLRAWRSHIAMATCAEPEVTWMRDTGISSRLDWPSLRKRLAEERSIHDKHADSLMLRAAYAVYWAAYLPYRWLLVHARRDQRA